MPAVCWPDVQVLTDVLCLLSECQQRSINASRETHRTSLAKLGNGELIQLRNFNAHPALLTQPTRDELLVRHGPTPITAASEPLMRYLPPALGELNTSKSPVLGSAVAGVPQIAHVHSVPHNLLPRCLPHNECQSAQSNKLP